MKPVLNKLNKFYYPDSQSLLRKINKSMSIRFMVNISSWHSRKRKE